MRKAHIDYLKALAASITLNGENPFGSDNFYEIQPPLDSFQEKAPFCVIGYNAVNNVFYSGSRPSERIVIQNESNKTIALLTKIINQSFLYQLDFWLNSPDDDILSDITNMGIIDQSLVYLYDRLKFTRDEYSIPIKVEVNAGQSGIITDPAGELGLYKIYLEVIFLDGIYKIENRETLAGVQFTASFKIK
ncbi:MAG: hypothetical protein H7A25_22190 [Leptospiraceae bacterium]|nr:hypothetical protein [Leptospiraceae bacterium]